MDIQIVIDPGHIGHRHLHNVLPNGAITPTAGLQFKGSGMGSFREVLIHLLLGRCGGIDLFQLRQGEGCFLGILAGVVGIEVAQIGLALLRDP